MNVQEKIDILNKWISSSHKVITITDSDNTKVINLTISQMFKINTENRNHVLSRISKNNKEYLSKCNKINNIYREEMLDGIEKLLNKDITEPMITYWTKETNATSKNLKNSLIILRAKYKKNDLLNNFKIFETFKNEIETNYNRWVGSGYNYKIFIYKNMEQD
jgi:hypothetical protein